MRKVKPHENSFNFGENINTTIFMLLISGLIIFMKKNSVNEEIVHMYIWGYFTTIFFSNFIKLKKNYYLLLSAITIIPAAYSLFIFIKA